MKNYYIECRMSNVDIDVWSDQSIESNRRIGFEVGQSVSGRVDHARGVQPGSTGPGHAGHGGRSGVLEHGDLRWDLHRDWCHNRVDLFSTAVGSPGVKPRDGFPAFLINTHLGAGLTAPVRKNTRELADALGLRL